MAFLFLKRNIYYMSLNYKGKRIRKSLGTKNKKLAQKIAIELEDNLLQELVTGKIHKQYSNSDIPDLIQEFMKCEHNWRPRTREIYETCFKFYLKRI